jgi:hypothetical protein
MATTQPKSTPSQEQTSQPTPDTASVGEHQEDSPTAVVEVVSIGDTVLEKTIYPNGECDVKSLVEPAITEENVRLARAMAGRI